MLSSLCTPRGLEPPRVARPTRVQQPRWVRTHVFNVGDIVQCYRLGDVDRIGERFRGIVTQYDEHRPRNSYLVEWDKWWIECLMDWWPRQQLVLWTPPQATNLGNRRFMWPVLNGQR